jgi:hypothetical protein
MTAAPIVGLLIARLKILPFVLQREVFKILTRIHVLAKPRRENISQQGHKGRKDRPFEFLKSVFVAFAILL